jgi:hypothetical protein
MWARVAAVLAGIWLMAAPGLFGYGPVAATAHYILGPIAAASATISFWSVTGALRWVGLPVGLLLLFLPVLGFGAAATANSLVAGFVLAGTSFVGTESAERFAGGWSSLWPPCSDGSGRQD